MSEYKVGSANINVGSSSVTGNSTSWTNNVLAGDLFRLSDDAAFYEVSGVQTATQLTLTARYRNSSYETDRSGEHVATCATDTVTYTATLDNTPVLLRTLVVLGSSERFSDSGGCGTLAGDSGGSGTIDYDTGALSITFNATPNTEATVTASYTSGDTISAMSYRITRDFTDYYNFPEMDNNSVNFPVIHTKAVRLIDKALYNASMNQATVAGDVFVSATPYGFVTKSDDGTKWRITVNNSGSLVTASFS